MTAASADILHRLKRVPASTGPVTASHASQGSVSAVKAGAASAVRSSALSPTGSSVKSSVVLSALVRGESVASRNGTRSALRGGAAKVYAGVRKSTVVCSGALSWMGWLAGELVGLLLSVLGLIGWLLEVLDRRVRPQGFPDLRVSHFTPTRDTRGTNQVSWDGAAWMVTRGPPVSRWTRGAAATGVASVGAIAVATPEARQGAMVRACGSRHERRASRSGGPGRAGWWTRVPAVLSRLLKDRC